MAQAKKNHEDTRGNGNAMNTALAKVTVPEPKHQIVHLPTISPSTCFSHLALTLPNYGFGTSPKRLSIFLCLFSLTLVISTRPLLGSGPQSAHSLCANEKRCLIFLADAALSQGVLLGKQSTDQIPESTHPLGPALKYRVQPAQVCPQQPCLFTHLSLIHI